MVDVWLIVVTVVIGVLMLAVNIYLFAMYCHPDDLSFGAGWFAKIVVVLGSAVIWAFILVLPLDIANARGDGGGFNMDLFYTIMFILYFVFIAFVLPFALYFYESDDEKSLISRICWAFCGEIFFAIVITVLALIAYGSFRSVTFMDLSVTSAAGFAFSESGYTAKLPTVYAGRVTFPLPPFLFMVVFLIFIGWFLFVIFGGIGLIALPMDWILDYFYRPQPRSAKELAERKVALRRTTEELLLFAQNIQTNAEEKLDEEGEKKGFFKKWKENRSVAQKEKKLNSELYKLEQEYEIWEVENTLKANPIWSAIKLIIGILFAILSFVILLHLIVFVLVKKDGKPASQFLNAVFVFLEFKVARFISTILFACLSMFILFTVIKGNIKFGLRLFFIMKIHPMQLGRTYMNSFLFNIILILLCVPSIIHFQIEMFKTYMNLTSGSFLFTTLLNKMNFFKWFYTNHVFFYAYIVWAGLTFLYLAFKPKSDRMDIKKIIEDRKKV